MTSRVHARYLYIGTTAERAATTPAATLYAVAWWDTTEGALYLWNGTAWALAGLSTPIKFGDIAGGNYTQFDSTGHQTMVGSAKPWDDLRIEPTARGTGANNPAFEQYFTNGSGSRGVYLYSFTDEVTNNQKEVFFTMQLPHAWDSGPIDMHVHWIGNANDTTAAPVWGLEYNWKEIGATFGNTDIVYTDGVNYVAGGTDANVTAGIHYLSKFSDITPGTTADGISSILIGRLFRFSGDASDTYDVAGNKCGLLYIDAHYQINSIGSTDEYTK